MPRSLFFSYPLPHTLYPHRVFWMPRNPCHAMPCPATHCIAASPAGEKGRSRTNKPFPPPFYSREWQLTPTPSTGASRIFIFDHTIRRQPADSASQPNLTDEERRQRLRGPVQRVHIDQSYEAALSRVPHHLPDEADRLLRSRVQIINVWRPIKPVQRDPLAVAEAQSVQEESLVPTALIYPNRRGETLNVKYDPGHR